LRAVIFANGHLSDPDVDRARLRSGDWILAADGGLHNARRLGVNPSVVIGDLDSIDPEDPPGLAALAASGATLVRHPQRKDETDLELALQYAVQQGAQEILVLGALGDRWDQTLANALLLASPRLATTRTWLADGGQLLTVIRGGQSITLEAPAGTTLSLLPLAGDALGVRTQGLEYTLSGETLVFSATRGISNTFLAGSATVGLDQGLLLVTLGGPPAAARVEVDP
jgi:thiamine pyrophosphokinase